MGNKPSTTQVVVDNTEQLKQSTFQEYQRDYQNEEERKRIQQEQEARAIQQNKQNTLQATRRVQETLSKFTPGIGPFKCLDLEERIDYDGSLLKQLERLSIAIVGPTGSGKSCFIKTAHAALDTPPKGIRIQSVGQRGTTLCSKYLFNRRYGISLIDTRGIEQWTDIENRVLFMVLNGKIRMGQTMDPRQWNSLNQPINVAEEVNEYLVTGDLERKAHAVLFVIRATDIKIINGLYEEYCQTWKEFFTATQTEPLVVLTHADGLSSQDDRDEIKKAVKATFRARHIFFLTNLGHGDDFESMRECAEILKTAALDASLGLKSMLVERQNQKSE